ncbi:hypothetical protein HGB24_01800 [Candidatus Saccharibacteria bacterium]|nr:hypothetical protein [Candidatus Saccharibacteria bacterium]
MKIITVLVSGIFNYFTDFSIVELVIEFFAKVVGSFFDRIGSGATFG